MTPPLHPTSRHRVATPARRGGVAALVLTLALSARAQNPVIDWYTIDGGGATFSTAGTLSLGGTIGQPDAGSSTSPMTGGPYTLVGGFWPVVEASSCTLPGDLNRDGRRDGRDIQLFVICVVGPGGPACDCADMDGNGVVDAQIDLGVFIQILVGG